jgi:DNA polymerase III subunit epsilon
MAPADPLTPDRYTADLLRAGGTPLDRVTFCVIDLETTGGSPETSVITEVGALAVRRGEILGTFQALVDPGRPVPAFVRLLTGISDEMVHGAPAIEGVLPNLLEFMRDAVLVAHNARFDVGFLNAALRRSSYPPVSNRIVDTASLARKVLAGEVYNNKLATLVRHLRCAHQPCHRAFADVLATTDVLHALIERAAGYGVTTLEDLEAMSSSRIDGTFSKIALARDVPRGTGVYRFLGAGGVTLYVGKAADLRSRVRSYFYGDPRRRVRDLLRETQAITVEPHASMLEAEVAEARAIARETPPYNRAGKASGAWYVKVELRARAARIAPARVAREDGCFYFGPFGSLRIARNVIDALRDARKIHRCTHPSRCRGCAFGDMGTCLGTDRDLHRSEVQAALDGLRLEPALLLEPLEIRMKRLVRCGRFEEAAELRARGELLSNAAHRHIETTALLGAGDICVRDGARAVLIRSGQVAAACDVDEQSARACVDRLVSKPKAKPKPAGSFTTAEVRREARVVASYLRRHAGELELLHVSGDWAFPCTARPVNPFARRRAAV